MRSPVDISTKLPKVGTTIFTVMSKMAQDHGAINLSQGFPDFEVDPVLIDLVSKEMRDGNNQYAPLAGAMPLREAIAKKTKELHGASYNPESEITVTAGATQAIFTAISALVKEEDEVIIFTPAYDCYVSPIILNYGKQSTSTDKQIKPDILRIYIQGFGSLHQKPDNTNKYLFYRKCL